MKQILSAEHIKKSYNGRTVVNNVSIQVEQGEVVGLLGPNGAGKTTSFYIMVGLIKSDEGKIKYGDHFITELPLHKRAQLGIGYLPQEASIFRELSVEENIFAALECTNFSKIKKNETLDSLLNDFNIGHIRKSKGRDLSGGERRRVEIARSLSLSPKFILLDEPFAGVDPLAISDIQSIIKDLKRRDIGVLITDHNVRETLGIVDRAYIMSEGKILVEGDPTFVINSESARKFYLGEEFKL